MATNLLNFVPSVVRAGATPNRRSDNAQRKPSSASSPNWWTPLFGWSSEADYMEFSSPSSSHPGSAAPEKAETRSETDKKSPPKKPSSRFAPGCFTEEKARRLRMLTSDTSSFHDAMYHSAIASRLASDFKDRSDL